MHKTTDENQMAYLRALVAWLLILVFAIGNGVLREMILLVYFPLPAAFMISGLLLSAIIFALAFVLAPWRRVDANGPGVGIGVMWLSREEVLAAYAFADGNIGPLVLLTTLFAPLAAQHIRYGSRERRI